jgi:hypothetical protein
MDDGKAGVLGGQTPSLLSDKPLKHPLQVQRALAGSSAIKIYIQEEGWYRISRSELVAAGLDPKAKPRFLHLYAQGEEQPLFFTGKKEDTFGPHDAVEFYATGLDTPYTETKVYWLTAGSKAGKRISKAEGHGARNGSSTDTFLRTVEDKPRSIYFPALNNGEAENFFGPMVWTMPVEQVLNIFSPSPSHPGEATLEVSLQGVTAGTHKVKVSLNDQEMETISFEGQGQGTTKIPLFQSVLKEGENKVSLVAVGSEADISLLDSIRLIYWSTYTAQEDQLKCAAPGGSQVVIDGFTTSRVRVVDITDPKTVQELSGVVRSQRAGYAIRVPVPEGGPRTLLAFSEDRVEKPADLRLNEPSSWYQAGNGADLVIISHGLFLENLKPLKTLREAQGYSVALIDVEDLYNEFSYGNKTPQAIRDFLIQATSYWRKPPRFVLLAGDASYDPRNYLGLGNFDLVPTKTVETVFMEAPSDNWFADTTGDGIPDLAIGRLPVRTVEEATTVISKIIAYDQTSGPLKDVLLVADMADPDFDFEKAASQVASLFPSTLTVWGISRASFDNDGEVKSELLRHLNEGRLWVNYIGHGSMDFWRGNIFTSKDARALTNSKRLSLFVNMTCLNGSFYSPNSDSLAEVLLKSDKGGAVAVWTSSGLTDPNQQLVMNKAFVQALFNGSSPTLGEATVKAKAALGAGDVTKTWILFGDPTTRLKY